MLSVSLQLIWSEWEHRPPLLFSKAARLQTKFPRRGLHVDSFPLRHCRGAQINPPQPSALLWVQTFQEGTAECIKSAQQLAAMASRMISVRTLQHPAGTDGRSAWSAEAHSERAAKTQWVFLKRAQLLWRVPSTAFHPLTLVSRTPLPQTDLHPWKI